MEIEMSKILCKCGYNIVIQKDSLPYAGEIIRSQNWESFYLESSKTIANFMKAILEGQREVWVSNFYGEQISEIANINVVCDILGKASLENLQIYQCEGCGRVLIEEFPGSFTYRFFMPEDENLKDILKGS